MHVVCILPHTGASVRLCLMGVKNDGRVSLKIIPVFFLTFKKKEFAEYPQYGLPVSARYDQE
jgi:hypothetical protein